MHRPTVIVVSDHSEVFDKARAGLEAELEVLALFPHAESVVAAAAAVMPRAVVVDLSQRSVRCAEMLSRLLDEIPETRLVLLLEPETNPDVKRRNWLERGLERDRLSPDLARGLDRAFGGKMRAIGVETRGPDAPPLDGFLEAAYSPTFSC